MAYLKKFTTVDEYNSFKRDLTKNYVSLISSTGEVKYDKGIPKGVYIQHIDGKLYTTDAWSAEGFTNEQANGVAVIDSNAHFVIAKSDASSGVVSWSSNNSTLIDGVFTTTQKDIAVTDYNGLLNTNVAAKTASSGAVYLCSSYTFPNNNNGYLPALGEWYVAYDNKAAVNEALDLIGGDALSVEYWSSTQSHKSGAWCMQWTNKYTWSNAKDGDKGVRAFTTL
jgi:hypothetical protein